MPAESTGFEPVKEQAPRVFETRAIGHYANSPYAKRTNLNNFTLQQRLNCKAIYFVASPSGVEPPTFGSAIQCSIH